MTRKGTVDVYDAPNAEHTQTTARRGLTVIALLVAVLLMALFVYTAAT